MLLGRRRAGAQLCWSDPNVTGVADDPEAAAVLEST